MKNKMTFTYLILLSFISLNTFAQDQPYQICDGHTHPVRSVAFSPDGQILASGGSDYTIRLWNPNTGAYLKTLKGHRDDVTSLAWTRITLSSVLLNQDGTPMSLGTTVPILASGSTDDTIRLWNANTGELLKTLEGHRSPVYSVAFSPDGQTLATAGEDNIIRLWNVQTGKIIKTFTDHTGDVRALVFSPDGQTLASGSDDKTIRTWDVNTGEPQNVFKAEGNPHDTATSMDFSPDGNTFGVNWGGVISLWDAKTGDFLKTLAPVETVVAGSYTSTRVFTTIAFSPNKEMPILASGTRNNTIHLWDWTTGTHLKKLTGHWSTIRSLAFSPDGQTLASGSDDKTIRTWDVNTKTHLKVFARHTGSSNVVSFSPDGQTLASGSSDETIRLWNPNTGELKKILHTDRNQVRSLAFSPDGNTLASGHYDQRSNYSQTIRLWNPNTGELKKILGGHSHQINSVAFSPDGQTLASGGTFNLNIRLWNPNTGELKKILKGHTGPVYSLAFSPDGQTLASGSSDRTIRLWNLNTRQTDKILETQSATDNLAFSPDGNTIAFSNRDNVSLWDYKHEGALIDAIGKHRNGASVSSIVFSPDGNTLISAGYTTILLWDMNTRQSYNILTQHQSHVYSLAFSPDGNTLASGDTHGRLFLWHVPDLDPRIITENNTPIQDNALKIPKGLITDVAFTNNHTYFVLNPQFLPEVYPANDYIRQKSTITLHLGRGISNYQMFSLKAPASVGDQWADIAKEQGEKLVLDLAGTVPFVSQALNIKDIIFSIRDIQDTNAHPHVTLSYFPNSQTSANSVAGNLTPILFVVPNQKLTQVGFEVKQEYYAKGDWVPINLEYEDKSDPLIELLPGFLRLPFQLVSGVLEGVGKVVYGTPLKIIEAINNNVLVNLVNENAEPHVLTYNAIWDLENAYQRQNYGLAAPSKSMTLAQYPPFQQLTPEVQAYLLQLTETPHIKKTVSTKAQQMPKEMALLPNYPNPFNPETWIPYQLATPADVTLTIYAVDGTVVRTLTLGHQTIGNYQDKSRAAYWDGKNQLGEPVASGVYFYTLTAGSFTETRKMLIKK